MGRCTNNPANGRIIPSHDGENSKQSFYEKHCTIYLMMQGRTLPAVPKKMKEANDNEKEQEQTNLE